MIRSTGMRPIAGLFVAVFLALPGLLHAQKVQFERFVMPSGLRVLVHSDDRSPVVSVGLMYKTGLNDEPSTLAGINAVVADMSTESSAHLSPGQYRSIMGTYGGKSTVDVSYDVTFFCDSFSSNMLKGAIWLAAEKAYGFREDTVAFAQVAEKVAGEASVRQRRTGDREEKALYDMVRTVNLRLVPEVATLDSGITMTAAKAYEKLYFNPKKAVLAISGDVNVDSVRRYVVEMFSLLPPDTLKVDLKPTLFSVRKPAADTVVLSGGKAVDVGSGILAVGGYDKHIDTLYIPQPNESVIFAWQIPPYSDPQFEVFDFISTVLCASSGSRLDKALVEEEGLATSVQPFILPMERASVFAFKVDLRPGVKISQAEAVVHRELERMRNFNITAGELKKAVNATQMSQWQYISSNEGMVRNMALTELLYGDAAVFNSRMEKLSTITQEDVRIVMRRFFRTDNMKTIYELPSSRREQSSAGSK